MYEHFNIAGKLQRLGNEADDFEEIKRRVKAVYPDALWQGSTAHWTFYVGGNFEPANFVAEAWLPNRRGTGWRFRIKGVH